MEHGVHSHGSDRLSRQGPERQQMVGAAEGMRTRGTLPYILDPLPGPSA